MGRPAPRPRPRRRGQRPGGRGHRDAGIADPDHRDHHGGQEGRPGRDRRHRRGAVPARHPGHSDVRRLRAHLPCPAQECAAAARPQRDSQGPVRRPGCPAAGHQHRARRRAPAAPGGRGGAGRRVRGCHLEDDRPGQAGGRAEEPASLYFDTTKNDPPNNFQIVAQVLVSIGMLIGGAQLFVSSIEQLAHGLGVDPLILTLVIAPLATELPETLNSVIWIRQGKDTLALGNITGALVLQSMPLVAFGMVFTSWRLTSPALTAMVAALAGVTLSLIAVLRTRGWSAPFVGCSAGLYLGGITAIIAVT